MTPTRLTPCTLSLLPILYIIYRNPVSSYSKAPWGLSVLSQVTSIFTSTTISPGTLLRQLSNHFPLTFQHWAGVSSYTSSFDLAETCVFVKQLLGPLLCDHTFIWYPFSLSYGVSLPSSLTMLLSLILGSSPHLPVSVCGTGTSIQYLQAFLASVLLGNSLLIFHYIFRYEFFLFLAFLPLLCPLHFLSISVVQEFLPAVHQIRLSASP